jgi:hypothetical protein
VLSFNHAKNDKPFTFMSTIPELKAAAGYLRNLPLPHSGSGALSPVNYPVQRSHDHQLRIVQHDLFFTIGIEADGSHGIMPRAFELRYFPKAEFLVLHAHAHFQL